MLAENAKDIKENVAIENDGFAYDLTGLPLLKLGKENYEMYHMFQPQLTTKPSKESGQFYSSSVIEGMDDFLIDRLEVCEGDASLLKDRDTRYVAILTHKLENGEYVLDENAPEIGEKISLAWAEGIEAGESGNVGQETEDSCAIYTGITEYEYTVCAYVEVPIDISERMSSGTYDVIVGSDMLRSDF
jgi:putative ABC transport system permease protein